MATIDAGRINYRRIIEAAYTKGVVGAFFVTKYRDAMLKRGAGPVAAQLRKQGVPLGVTLRILFGKGLRPN